MHRPVPVALLCFAFGVAGCGDRISEDRYDRITGGTPRQEVENPSAYDESVPKPTRSGIRYGKHERHILDFWQAPSDRPTPLVLVIHGGSWKGNSKEIVHRFVDVAALL